MQHSHPELYAALMFFRELFIKKYLRSSDIGTADANKLKEVVELETWTPVQAFDVYSILTKFEPRCAALNQYLPPFSKPVINRVAETKPATGTATPYKGRYIGFANNIFIIGFPYDKTIHEYIKGIEGRGWDGDNRRWTAPLSARDHMKKLVEKYGFHLSDQARYQLTVGSENMAQSYSTEYIELGLPLKLPPFAYQTVSADYCIKNKRVIVGDEMGVGKTLTGIMAMMGTNSFPCIVSCPKTLRTQWKEEWERFTNKKAMVVDANNFRFIQRYIELGMCDVAIINHDGIYTHFIDGEREVQITKGKYKGTSYKLYQPHAKAKLFKGMVVDEGHEMKNKSTRKQRTHKAVSSHMDTVVVMTGSPIVTGPKDLGSLIDLIGQDHHFGGYYKFCKDYKDFGKDMMSSDKLANSNYKLKALNDRLRSICFIRRELAQVQPQMPKKMRQVIKVELDNQKEYDHALHFFQDWLAKCGKNPEEISRSMQAEALVQIGILKQVASKGKLSAVKEYVQNVTSQGKKVIIAVWYNETAQFFKDHFPKAAYITGKMNGRVVTQEEIDRNKYLFQNDPECNVIIVSYKKGGVGHNLTAASYVVEAEQGWTYKDKSQMEARSHRTGQLETVNIASMLGAGTVDEDIHKVIMMRADMEKAATGSSTVIDTEEATLGDLLKKIIEKNSNSVAA